MGLGDHEILGIVRETLAGDLGAPGDAGKED